MLEIQAQIHIQMEADLTLSCLMMVFIRHGNPDFFPVRLKLIFPAPPQGAQSLAFLITVYGNSIFFPQLCNPRT